jgi:hypothetical protein
MSKFKLLFAAAILLVLVVVILATHNVSAGDPTGGPHDLIKALI